MKRLLAVAGIGTGLLVLGLGSAPLAAQNDDRGTLIIRAGTREVGSETFTIASDSVGLRLSAHTVYGIRGGTDLTASFDRSREGELGFQLERRGPQQAQVYAVQKRNRVTVRRVERGAEQASELPGGPGTVLLADSVFSLLLQLVPLADDNRPVQVLFPQGIRRITLTVERVSAGPGSLVRFQGGLEGEIQLGDHGEVLRIHLPSLGLEAIRKRE